jgi:hypothetical protein
VRFFKRFLKNLWNCILIVFFLALGVAALLAPTYLAATFNNAKWLLLYVVYGIPLLAFIVALVEDDDY